ncbi:MAG: glycosyltransferase family 39 protein [Phycisphaeraceae bacterium]
MQQQPVNWWRDRRIALAIVLFAALFMRGQDIMQPMVDAFSWRQASTAMMAANFYTDSWNIFYPQVSWTGPGPSYQGREFQTVTWLTAALYTVLGQHDWVARGVTVMFGVWGVFAFYQLVRRVWDDRHAFAAALVLALLPGAAFIDRSFLPDPGMLALIVTALWLWVAYLQTDRWGYLAGALALGSLGLLTKLPGLVVLAAGVYAAVAIPGSRGMLSGRRVAWLVGLWTAALLPVGAYYAWAVYLGNAYPPYHVAGSDNWLWEHGPRAWLAEGYFLERAGRHAYKWLWTLPAMLLIVIGFGCPPPRRSGEAMPGAPWFFHWWWFGALVLYALAARELVVNPWNLHIVNPLVAAFAGRALVVITTAGDARERRPWLATGGGIVSMALIAALLVTGQAALSDMKWPHADQSRRLGLELKRLSAPGDLVVTVPNDIGDPIAIYYSGRRGWVFPPGGGDVQWSLLPEDGPTAIEMFESLRAQGARWFGVVASTQDQHQPRRSFHAHHVLLIEHIRRTCELVGDNDAWTVYRIPPADDLPGADAPSAAIVR